MYKKESIVAKIGKSGEDKLKVLLERQGYTVQNYVYDESEKNRKMQGSGIDMKLTKSGLSDIYLDVKTNLINDDYCYLELSKTELRDGSGWFFKSQADRIYHYDDTNNTYFYYNLKEMRQKFLNGRIRHGDIFVAKNGTTLKKIHKFALLKITLKQQ